MRKIHLAKFLEKHEEWCETVAYNYLQVKWKTWKQFKVEWLHESFTLNMVGIFIWARAYHRHVAVFFGYNYWTSHINHDLNKVYIFLLYRGNNRFDKTHMIGGIEYCQCYNEFSKIARKIERYFAKQHAAKEKKEKEQKKQQGHVDSDFTKDVEYDDPENGEDLELDMEKMMEGTKDSENVQKNDNAVEINNNDGNVQNTNEDLNSDDAKLHINQEKELPESNESVDNVDNVQRRNDALKKEQEVLQSDESDGNVQKKVTDVNVTKAGKGAIKIEGGTIQTSAVITAGKLRNKAKSRVKGTWHFAKKCQKIDKKARTCKLCGQLRDTLEKLEKHMRQKHKKFKYKCHFCAKLYQTKNGLYKHKLYHTVGLQYICKKCDKGFMFFSQYREHSNIHTQSVKHKFPCQKKGCDKYYSSTHARNYHEKHHKTKILKCAFQEKKGGPICSLTCNSSRSLAIHI